MGNYTKGEKKQSDCGCKIIRLDKYGTLSIEYCPKHKAAPDMYEALRMSLGLARYIQITHPENEPIKNQVKQIEQALSKADKP